MRGKLAGLLAGVGFAALSTSQAFAQELTIFWAEWDPANYLQELVNEYEAETGVKVTVETTPWSDFQTKAFTEFNAKGGCLRHDRRRQPVAGRGLDRPGTTWT